MLNKEIKKMLKDVPVEKIKSMDSFKIDGRLTFKISYVIINFK